MTAAEQTAAFCSALLDALDESGRSGLTSTVWVNSPTGKATKWVSATADAVTEAAREADAGPGANTYISMGVSRIRGRANQRMSINDVAGITCVWMEIDIAGQAHAASNLPDTVDKARRVIDSAGLAPSLVWNSGNGLQAAWLLDEPWIFADEPNEALARTHARELLRDWRASFAVRAHAMGGWKVDAVHDLSRVLRVPGTTNRKVLDDGTVLPTKPCVLVECEPSRRYTIDDLHAHMVDKTQRAAFASAMASYDPEQARKSGIDQFAIWRMARSYGAPYTPEWVEQICEFDPSFAEVWRNGAGGDSETDASLARRLADHDVDQAMAVEAIFCHRLRIGRKLDKVDPNARQDYVLRTVQRFYEIAEQAKREKNSARSDAELALARQQARRDAIAAEAEKTALDPRVLDPPDGPPTPAGVADHILDRTTDVVLDSRSPAPPADDAEHDVPPVEEYDEDDIPADDVPVDAYVTRPPAVQADMPGTPDPRNRPDPIAVVRERDGAGEDGGDGMGGAETPERNPWSGRTQEQVDELTNLSNDLFGSAPGAPKVWRLFQRGRGATAQRRVQIRLPEGWVWSTNTPPIGYRPGYPLHTGWWPSATFDGFNGWFRALRQDLKLRPNEIPPQQFATRYGDSLVELWDTDDSRGSLATIITEALPQYLINHPPSREWTESVVTGTPNISQRMPYWDIDSPFRVLVRWADVLRYVRVAFALGVNPVVAAELEEASRVLPVSTPEQNGLWRLVEVDCLSRAQWETVLAAGSTADENRTERRRLRLVSGGDIEGAVE